MGVGTMAERLYPLGTEVECNTAFMWGCCAAFRPPRGGDSGGCTGAIARGLAPSARLY